ncbi:MAG: hypothetical protein UIG59_06450 [Acutalibacteraceae bacterium]|nr:hypothetical protein [Acutalibacteraceae bacterium]
MKMLKKVTAILLALAFIFTLSACHPKDEVAISAGDYKITSAMYSYFLVLADSEAKNLINNDDKIDTEAKGFSYLKQKIGDKTYEEYVKETALNSCLRYMALEKICKEKKYELDKEEKKNWQSTAQYYWNYSLGGVMLENGVAYSTYEKIMLNDALYNLYFDKTYGKDGEKAVSDADIKKGMENNYTAVYMITHDYSKEKEPKVEDIQKKLQKYVDMFKEGKTYDEVLKAYNADNGVNDSTSSTTSSTTTSSGNSSTTTSTTSSDKNSSTTTSTTSSDKNSSTTTSTTSSDKDSSTTSSTTSSQKEEEKKPVDSNIKLLTKYEETYTAGSTYFKKYADVAKLEKDGAALIHDEDAKTFYIVVKKDINEDPYYLDTLTEEIIYLLKSDEYDKFIEDTYKALDYTVNDYAVNQFKVKNIFDGSQAQ